MKHKKLVAFNLCFLCSTLIVGIVLADMYVSRIILFRKCAAGSAPVVFSNNISPINFKEGKMPDKENKGGGQQKGGKEAGGRQGEGQKGGQQGGSRQGGGQGG